MAKKKITIADLAVMVQKGFEGLRGEMHGETGGIRAEIKDFREEVNDRFAYTNARLDTLETDVADIKKDLKNKVNREELAR